jgi:hypothetical protein
MFAPIFPHARAVCYSAFNISSMDQVYDEVLNGALKALFARRAEIDSTMKTIRADPTSISTRASWTATLDREVQDAIARLYEIRSLVDDMILHLTRLARMRKLN